MKDIYIFASVIIVIGIAIIASCWNDRHILAPLAILGGGGCIIAGILLIAVGLMK